MGDDRHACALRSVGGADIAAEVIADDRFVAFVAAVEPPLRRSLVATLGPDRGHAATVAALAYSWTARARVCGMDNPVAYLSTVGRSATSGRPSPVSVGDRGGPRPAGGGARPAVAGLRPRERQCLDLVVACGWAPPEVATVLGLSAASVERHVARALERLHVSAGPGSGA